MKILHTTRITILIIVIAVLAGGETFGQMSGQTQRNSTSHVGQGGRRSSSEDEQRDGGCTTRFDRFRNRNTMTIEPRTILSAGTDELKLGASAVVEENNAAPREIDLLFDSTTNRMRYGNSAEVRFIVDERRIEGGTAYKFGGSAMRQVNEKLRLTIPASRFLEIINGREVEMQIGETEVTLRREDLGRLWDFAACAHLRVRSEQ